MSRVAACIPLAIALTGCAGTMAPPPPPMLAINPFDRIGARPNIFLTAQLAGRLVADRGCVRVRIPHGWVTLLWPEGTVLSNRRIVLPDNRGAARIGASVSLGGGSAPDDRANGAGIEPDRCPGPYFAVANAN